MIPQCILFAFLIVLYSAGIAAMAENSQSQENPPANGPELYDDCSPSRDPNQPGLNHLSLRKGVVSAVAVRSPGPVLITNGANKLMLESTYMSANPAVIHLKLSKNGGDMSVDSSEAQLCSSYLPPSTIPEDVIVYNDTEGLGVRNIGNDTLPSGVSSHDGAYLVYLTEEQRSSYEQALCKPIDPGTKLPQSVVCVCVVPLFMMESKPPPSLRLRMTPLRPIASDEGKAFTMMMRELGSMDMADLDPCLTDSLLPVKCEMVDGQFHRHHLKELNLTSRGLNGTLSANIASFAHLELLVLTNNTLHFSSEAEIQNSNPATFSSSQSTIPASMPSLRWLHLDNNSFGNGNFSAEEFGTQLQKLADPRRLEVLNLANNYIQLDFNTTFYNFENLTYLNIAGNNFTGEVDAERFRNTTICAWAGNEKLNFSSHYNSCERRSNTGRSPLKNKSHVFMFMGIAVAVVVGITMALFIALKAVKKSKPRVCPKKCSQEREARAEEPLCHFLLESRFRGSGETRRAGVTRQASSKAAGFLRKPRLHFHCTESPWRLTVEDIEDATSCFETPVAKGSFGDAFKGIINKNDVAVKFRAKTSFSAVMSNFQKDLESITSLNHENLAKVLGFCDSEHYQALVIEYFPKGSLEDHLHGDHAEEAVLNTWGRRLKLMIGAARAVEYIHGECSFFPKRTAALQVHANIKSSNVLIEDELNAKITDFGLYSPKLFNDKCHSDLNLFFAGYLDPDYMTDEGRKEIDKKSDVYSFGVVLLEVITGRTPIVSPTLGETPQHIRQWVQESKASGGMESIIDRRITEAVYSIDSLTTVLELALWCTEINPSSRPSIKQVKQRLETAFRSENISSKSKANIELQVPPDSEV